MTLALVGGTHRTVPLALRERLVFTAEQAAEALGRFRNRFPGREGVLLSTCNRVEFYAGHEALLLRQLRLAERCRHLGLGRAQRVDHEGHALEARRL